MALTESNKFIEKLHALEKGQLTCIKFREGNIYYGQVERVEVSTAQFKENSSKLDHSSPVLVAESIKPAKGKEDKTKGGKHIKEEDKDEEPANENTMKVRHGLGVQIYYKPDGSVISKYEGSWFRGKKHGHASVVYPDKSSYVGHFKNDFREGRGLFRWTNGYIYDGEWKEDKMEGQGKLTTPKGEVISSYFRSNCIMARKGIYVNPFLSERESGELLEKRENTLQQAVKAATPSEKALIFEMVSQPDRIRAIIEFTKEKARVPLFLSTKP